MTAHTPGPDELPPCPFCGSPCKIESTPPQSRIEENALRGEIYGATFTLRIGYNSTHLHTQSGSQANPVECLRKAIGVFIDELARVQRCPRQRALMQIVPAPKRGTECHTSPTGNHIVDTSMESGPHNCFHCERPMP